MEVSVVLPAYNEERLIGPTLDSVPEFVDVVYVANDASTDRPDLEPPLVLLHTEDFESTRHFWTEVLGFTTAEWSGGRALKDYQRAGSPEERWPIPPCSPRSTTTS